MPIRRRSRAWFRRLCKQLGKGPRVQEVVLRGVQQVVWAWPGGPPHGNGGGTGGHQSLAEVDCSSDGQPNSRRQAICNARVVLL